MEGPGSSGFDVSKLSTAAKLLAGGGILFLINSLFPWQRLCLEGLAEGDGSATCNMWRGDGGFVGIIAGLLTIALVVLVILSLAGVMRKLDMGTMRADTLVAYVGLGVAGFGILKFLFVLLNRAGWAAFVGLLLLIAIAYGAWQQLQDSGGFQMEGGAAGGTMGDDTLPPSEPPPSTPPPSGGMPPSGSSDT